MVIDILSIALHQTMTILHLFNTEPDIYAPKHILFGGFAFCRCNPSEDCRNGYFSSPRLYLLTILPYQTAFVNRNL